MNDCNLLNLSQKYYPLLHYNRLCIQDMLSNVRKRLRDKGEAAKESDNYLACDIVLIFALLPISLPAQNVYRSKPRNVKPRIPSPLG